MPRFTADTDLLAVAAFLFEKADAGTIAAFCRTTQITAAEWRRLLADSGHAR